MIGSSWIHQKDASGISTRTPDSEKMYIPYPIVAQFETHILLPILAPLRTLVLQRLEGMIVRNKTEDWYTVYLAVFILLHEVAVATKDQTVDPTATSPHVRFGFFEITPRARLY